MLNGFLSFFLLQNIFKNDLADEGRCLKIDAMTLWSIGGVVSHLRISAICIQPLSCLGD